MAKKGKPTYDQRARNFYGHQEMNLKARRAMEEAGVKDKRALPMAVYRSDKMIERLEEGDKLRAKKRPARPSYAKGGKIDGIAKKGHTKGRMR